MTGASRGIGRGIAERLAAEGFALTLTGRHREPLEELARAVVGTAAGTNVVPADMIAASDIAELVVALTRLSARAVVPAIVVARRGETQWRA